MKYFKVQKGYKPDDFIGIDETELEMAIRAQITGKVGVFKEGTVSGNNIISITPDWNRVMGYNRDYALQGEDYREIGNSRQDEYRLYLTESFERVERQIQGLPPIEKKEAEVLPEERKRLSDKFTQT